MECLRMNAMQYHVGHIIAVVLAPNSIVFTLRFQACKFSDYSISGSLLSWCESYISGRNSKVLVNGYSSEPYLGKSGVPQGLHLGPLFFNVFLNDFGKLLSLLQLFLYTDDLKFLRQDNNIGYSVLLQEELITKYNINNVTLRKMYNTRDLGI